MKDKYSGSVATFRAACSAALRRRGIGEAESIFDKFDLAQVKEQPRKEAIAYGESAYVRYKAMNERRRA